MSYQEEKWRGIEKDLHNARSRVLLIKNLACNNTRYGGAKKARPYLIIIIVIIFLQRQRMGLFSGRENVNSQLSDDECRAVEEKQS